MPVAAIDVGTNTAKLVVAEPGDPAGLRVLHDDRRFIRLGEGVDATRRIQPAAVERLLAALTDLRDAAHAHGASDVFVGATSASRDADNVADVIEAVRASTGLAYTILSGDDEAALAFAGALSAFPAPRSPVAVVDIGGGSTELVGRTPGADGFAARSPSEFDFRTSLDIGSVRLTERCFSAQPPAPGEAEAAEAFVRGLLAASGVPHEPGRLLVGAAGTTGSLARLHHGFLDWADLRGRPVTLARADVQAWRTRLAPLPYDATLALNPRVLHGRADIFHAGTIILDEVMGLLGADRLLVSPCGLRHGLALRALGRA